LAVGDRWLFFLRQNDGPGLVLDYYSNISRPVADAQDQIETLRRRKTIGHLAIVRGRVEGGPNSSDRLPVPGMRLVASRNVDHAQYFTTTNANGPFEFEPLAPGKYDVTADQGGSFRPDGRSLDVTAGSCRNLTMSRYPHARISGLIRRSNGSPVANATVFIMNGDGYNTVRSDRNGHFESSEMFAGKYAVGIDLPDAPAWKYGGCGGPRCETPPIDLYYPGVHDRSTALVIALAGDENRDDIDFTVLDQ
jgi:Carboxypeptidase regulatory-like domain